MTISTAERNRRKRQRKKLSRRLRQNFAPLSAEPSESVEIDYVPEPLRADAPSELCEAMRLFQSRSSKVSDDEAPTVTADEEAPSEEEEVLPSRRKMREAERPSVAELKNRVKRADLVEAHDVTARDPDFLIDLKSVPGTVAVPRHWGRKRKYLQGKRGVEKAPFALPDFIIKTGICEMRTAIQEDETKMSEKQKNRARVAPKMGSIDVDYRTLHDAFFKHQTKPKLTKFSDVYYEGKEYETQNTANLQPGVLSERLMEALGINVMSPPPWLVNMQRYGPPPSYPNLSIPGLNAPIPEGCSYGYHTNGWGKPPIDQFGRPLYGGDPFGKPVPLGSIYGFLDKDGNDAMVTSDGKALSRKPWGALPDVNDEEEEESSDEEMDEDTSSEEEEEEEQVVQDEEDPIEEEPQGGADSVLPASSIDLRKARGDETPVPPAPKQLYRVLHQTQADKEHQEDAVFKSQVAYVLPDANKDGAESVLAKTLADQPGNKRKIDDDDDAHDLGKEFKF